MLFHYYWDAGKKIGLITAPNIILVYTIETITLRILIYGISHRFSLNEFSPFYIFFLQFYLYLRTIIYR
jgi:hypothetical protein